MSQSIGIQLPKAWHNERDAVAEVARARRFVYEDGPAPERRTCAVMESDQAAASWQRVIAEESDALPFWTARVDALAADLTRRAESEGLEVVGPWTVYLDTPPLINGVPGDRRDVPRLRLEAMVRQAGTP